MKDQLKELKRLAREAELQLTFYPNDHVQISGGAHVVHYWPYSHKMTAYIEGSARGNRRSSAADAIRMAIDD